MKRLVVARAGVGRCPTRRGMAETLPPRARGAGAATTPEMCNGRSDPNLRITAQATESADTPAYFLNVSTDGSGTGSGSLIAALPGHAERLVVTDWCRVWQHLPGQPSNGSCGMTYPPGAVTAHVVGTTTLDGEELLVRSDVRQLASGDMLYRIRYRPLATETATDDCETGWTKLPAEGWYSLDSFAVGPGTPPAGYQLAGSDGSVFSFDAPFHGSLVGTPLNEPVVGMTADPVTHGYRMVTTDGGVFSFDAPFHGSLVGTPLNRPVVGMAVDPPTDGYWLAASDGGVFALGGVPFRGSMGGRPLAAPVVGVAADPATGGYWLVAADGGVFGFDAAFYGSAGGLHLRAPVVGMASTPSGHGYWLVAADGGVLCFGDATFYGSRAATPTGGPVTGMAVTATGHGYWLVAADGGVYAYGDAGFRGSWSRGPTGHRIVSVSAAT